MTEDAELEMLSALPAVQGSMHIDIMLSVGQLLDYQCWLRATAGHDRWSRAWSDAQKPLLQDDGKEMRHELGRKTVKERGMCSNAARSRDI